MTTDRLNSLSPVTIFTGTAALVTANNVVSAAVDFSQAGSAQGYPRGYFSFNAGSVLAAVPTANSGLSIYTLKCLDGTISAGVYTVGTTYETSPASTIQPVGVPKATIPFDSNTTTQVRCCPEIDSPSPVSIKFCLYNGSGQTLPSGWTLTWTPIADQGV